VRKVVALCLWVLTAAGCSTVLCGSDGNAVGGYAVAKKKVTREGHVAAGLRALRDDDLARAEREFSLADDPARLAEVFVRQGRYDEAALEVAHLEDGGAKLMLALAHRGRGETTEYRRRLVEARNLGNVPALRLLEQERADAAGG
jgi:hypothetical protein